MTTAESIAILVALVGLISNGVACYVALSLRAGLAGETNKQRDWINGSFMRTKEVEAKFETIHAELVAIGQRLNYR